MIAHSISARHVQSVQTAVYMYVTILQVLVVTYTDLLNTCEYHTINGIHRLASRKRILEITSNYIQKAHQDSATKVVYAGVPECVSVFSTRPFVKFSVMF